MPREFASVAESAGRRCQEIGIERNDDIGIIESILRIDISSERQPGSRASIVAIDRLILVPARSREFSQNLLEQVGEGW